MNEKLKVEYVTINGITKTVSQWCEETGVLRHTAYTRIRKGWNPEKAVTEKPKKGRRKNG